MEAFEPEWFAMTRFRFLAILFGFAAIHRFFVFRLLQIEDFSEFGPIAAGIGDLQDLTPQSKAAGLAGASGYDSN